MITFTSTTCREKERQCQRNESSHTSSLDQAAGSPDDLVNVVEVVGGGRVDVQREGLRGQHWRYGRGQDPRLRAVAVSDEDVEQRTDGGVPGGEATELSGQVRHLAPPIGSVLCQETRKCLSMFDIAKARPIELFVRDYYKAFTATASPLSHMTWRHGDILPLQYCNVSSDSSYPKLKAVQAWLVLQESSQVSRLLPATVLVTVWGPSLLPGHKTE